MEELHEWNIKLISRFRLTAQRVVVSKHKEVQATKEGIFWAVVEHILD